MAQQATEGNLRTYIFLDVDGVLNVGVNVLSGGAPLLFSENNVQYAQLLAKGTPRPKDEEKVEKMLAIGGREIGHGDGGTYSALATTGNKLTVPLFVERLARLLRAAGPHCQVVLCSSWRLPKHQGPMKRLERDISKYLGEDFAFKEKTPCRDDNTPAMRLRCIGEYIHGLGAPSGEDKLRVLVLDDIFVSELRGLRLGYTRVDSVEGAERYLQGRSRAPGRTSVRLVKPFDEWATPTGRQVRIGAGLTMEHFSRAMLFLGADAGCGCGGGGPRGSSAEISDVSTTDEAPEETSPASSPKEKIAPKAEGRVDKKAVTRCVQAPVWLTAALPPISLLAPKRSSH